MYRQCRISVPGHTCFDDSEALEIPRDHSWIKMIDTRPTHSMFMDELCNDVMDRLLEETRCVGRAYWQYNAQLSALLLPREECNRPHIKSLQCFTSLISSTQLVELNHRIIVALFWSDQLLHSKFLEYLRGKRRARDSLVNFSETEVQSLE